MGNNIWVVLPAYNESLDLLNLMTRISNYAQWQKRWHINLLVVNDGSTDNTSEIAKNADVFCNKHVLDIIPNKGLANAVRQGINYVLSQPVCDDDIIVIQDADDTQSPFLIDDMAYQILKGSDVVIASRYRDGARILGLTAFRKLTSWCAGAIFRVFTPIKGVRDYTCGFRAYRVGILHKAKQVFGEKFIEEEGFACMAEILLKLKKVGAIFHEVPMILRYDRKQGASKMNVGRTIKQTLNLVKKHAFR